jgi:hypothetical protein
VLLAEDEFPVREVAGGLPGKVIAAETPVEAIPLANSKDSDQK